MIQLQDPRTATAPRLAASTAHADRPRLVGQSGHSPKARDIRGVQVTAQVYEYITGEHKASCIFKGLRYRRMPGSVLEVDKDTLEAVHAMMQSMIRQACQTFPAR